MTCEGVAFEFYPGESPDFEFELWEIDEQTGCETPYQMESSDSVSVEFPTNTTTNKVYTKTSTPAVVPSTTEKWKGTIMAIPIADAETFIDGSIKITVTRSSKPRVFVAEGACKVLTLPNC
jgi:hypothetical protein